MTNDEATKVFYELVMLPLGKSVQAWVRGWDGCMNAGRAFTINGRFYARMEEFAGKYADELPESSPLTSPASKATLLKLLDESGLLPRTWEFLAMNGGPSIGPLPEIKLPDKAVPAADAELIERICMADNSKIVNCGRLAIAAGEVAYTWTRVPDLPESMVLQDAGSPTRRIYLRKPRGAWEKALDFDGAVLPGQNVN